MAHELSLSPGLTVFVTRKHRTGWWEGVLADGTKGWFPSNILDPTPLAHQGASTSDTPAGPAPGGRATDLSKAPGYGAYASMPAPAAQQAMAAAPGFGAYAGLRGPGGKGGAGMGGRANGMRGGASDGGPGHDARIPAALTKETVALLRELRAVASQLRGSHSRQRKASADAAAAAAAAAAAGGSLDADLSAEATIASLQAQLATQAREAQAQRDLCARLERDKAAAEERCGHVEEELRACAAERDRALEELETIKQDPDLYFAGIATGDGRGGDRGGGSKRRSGVSMASSGDDVDFDEEDVDFESHAPRGG